jgi:uncharacterized repeat protein (TIGR03803 family)
MDLEERTMRPCSVAFYCAVLVGLATAAGGSATRIVPLPGRAAPIDAAPKYKVIYRFKSGTDGQEPVAGLVALNGEFYGTTSRGGTGVCVHGQYADPGCGTVYAVSAAGVEHVVYDFLSGLDGSYPAAKLIAVGGTLYGTTFTGGGRSAEGSQTNYGTVFSMTTAGAETILYHFGQTPSDLFSNPKSSLTYVHGTFYGTTALGGSACRSPGGCGSVYEVTAPGAGGLLYGFGTNGPSTDGYAPVADLREVQGTFYGTTQYGGTYVTDGTVFSVTTAGEETVLHSFGAQGDGQIPMAGLAYLSGTFYGTTAYGGAHGYGTVFAMSPSGAEQVLYSFTGGADGSRPSAGLTILKGALFGTTELGGTSGEGTVFRLSTSGTETVLHSFGGGTDGTIPLAGLLDVDGTLYGTTSTGGGSACLGTPPYGGCGTVFSVTP